MGNLDIDTLIDRVSARDVPIGIVNRKDLPRLKANFRVAHVFVFDRKNRLLLQCVAAGQRSEGLWGSSVAGYVAAGEEYRAAAKRKIRDEIGVSPRLRIVGQTQIEDFGGRKFIRLFRARSDGPFELNYKQIEKIKFMGLPELQTEMAKSPENFTATFRHLLKYFLSSRSG